jgi:hypothetical protein
MTFAKTLIHFINQDAKVLDSLGYEEVSRNQFKKKYDVSVCYFTRMMHSNKCLMRRSKGNYESFTYGDKTNKQPILFNVKSLIEVTDKILQES